MPILVDPPPPPLTQEQLDYAIKAFLDSPTGFTDNTGKPVTVRQALHRGAWAYDQRARWSKLEAEDVAGDAADAELGTRLDATEGDVATVKDALGKPILPPA